jgi:hypothetical protein
MRIDGEREGARARPEHDAVDFLSSERAGKTPIVLETSNVAVSLGLFGTISGVQLLAVSHKPSPGLRFQVALPPKAVAAAQSENSRIGPATRERKMPRRRATDRSVEVPQGEVALLD